MVRMLCLWVILLAVLLGVGGDVQAQVDALYQQPQGELFQRGDGTYGYIVSSDDRVGQWQVAFGSPRLWSELVKVNPQLADPDQIWPGNELNVPPSLVRLFMLMSASKATERDWTWNPPTVVSGLTNPEPVEATEWSFPFGGLWLLLAAFIAFLIYRYARSRERTASDRYYGGRIQGLQEQAVEADRRERARVLADPYAGPPVVEGGLPTPEAAMEHFTRAYREERNQMTVAQSAQLPVRVSVDRIVPVWVRGEMGVRQGGSSTPVRKVLERREPAWRAYLSDGSSRITLWRCGNDVYAGNGYDILPETQIEERTDLPSYTSPAPQQVWPEVAPATPTEVPTPPTATPTTLEFTSVKFDGPHRLVFQPGARVLDFGPLVAQGFRVAVSVQNGEVIVDNNGQRVVFGRIVETPEPVVASPEAATAIPATAEAGTARAIDEIVTAAGSQS